MAALNKVMLIGYLGNFPERRMVHDTSCTTFSLAVTEYYNDKNGQRQQKTEWASIVLWGKLAEIAAQYLQKGSQVYIEGKLETQSWTDKNSGEKKYRTQIKASSLQMLDKKGNEQSTGTTSTTYAQNNQTAWHSEPPAPEDDLPF